MTLILDLGNSTLSMAIFDPSGAIVVRTRLSSRKNEFLSPAWIDAFQKEISHYTFSYTILSSVVPSLNTQIKEFLSQFTQQIHVIDNSSYSCLPIELINPKEIGTDLIANAVYAWQHTQSSCAVIDFGTALSFTMVNAHGLLSAVAIAPGLGLALNSLIQNTEQLKDIAIKVPATVLGTDTIMAIQSGTILGYKYLVEGLVSQIKKELGEETRFFLTGGFSAVFAAEFAEFIYEHNLDLTLEGIYQIGQFIRKKPL